MYIIYSNNLKNGIVSSTKCKYKHRDTAISNLITEAEFYLLNVKRVKDYKVVEKMDHSAIVDGVQWYIENTDDTIVSLYYVTCVKGYVWGRTYTIDKLYLFSIMDAPTSNEETQEDPTKPESPRRVKRPLMSEDRRAMLVQLSEVLRERRIAMCEDEDVVV